MSDDIELDDAAFDELDAIVSAHEKKPAASQQVPLTIATSAAGSASTPQPPLHSNWGTQQRVLQPVSLPQAQVPRYPQHGFQQAPAKPPYHATAQRPLTGYQRPASLAQQLAAGASASGATMPRPSLWQQQQRQQVQANSAAPGHAPTANIAQCPPPVGTVAPQAASSAAAAGPILQQQPAYSQQHHAKYSQQQQQQQQLPVPPDGASYHVQLARMREEQERLNKQVNQLLHERDELRQQVLGASSRVPALQQHQQAAAQKQLQDLRVQLAHAEEELREVRQRATTKDKLLEERKKLVEELERRVTQQAAELAAQQHELEQEQRRRKELAAAAAAAAADAAAEAAIGGGGGATPQGPPRTPGSGSKQPGSRASGGRRRSLRSSGAAAAAPAPPPDPAAPPGAAAQQPDTEAAAAATGAWAPSPSMNGAAAGAAVVPAVSAPSIRLLHPLLQLQFRGPALWQRLWATCQAALEFFLLLPQGLGGRGTWAAPPPPAGSGSGGGGGQQGVLWSTASQAPTQQQPLGVVLQRHQQLPLGSSHTGPGQLSRQQPLPQAVAAGGVAAQLQALAANATNGATVTQALLQLLQVCSSDPAAATAAATAPVPSVLGPAAAAAGSSQQQLSLAEAGLQLLSCLVMQDQGAVAIVSQQLQLGSASITHATVFPAAATNTWSGGSATTSSRFGMQFGMTSSGSSSRSHISVDAAYVWTGSPQPLLQSLAALLEQESSSRLAGAVAAVAAAAAWRLAPRGQLVLLQLLWPLELLVYLLQHSEPAVQSNALTLVLQLVASPVAAAALLQAVQTGGGDGWAEDVVMADAAAAGQPPPAAAAAGGLAAGVPRRSLPRGRQSLSESAGASAVSAGGHQGLMQPGSADGSAYLTTSAGQAVGDALLALLYCISWSAVGTMCSGPGSPWQQQQGAVHPNAPTTGSSSQGRSRVIDDWGCFSVPRKAVAAVAALLSRSATWPLLQLLLPVEVGPMQEGLAQRLLGVAASGACAGTGGAALFCAVPSAAAVAALHTGMALPAGPAASSSSNISSSRGSSIIDKGCSVAEFLERLRLVQECLLLLKALLSHGSLGPAAAQDLLKTVSVVQLLLNSLDMLSSWGTHVAAALGCNQQHQQQEQPQSEQVGGGTASAGCTLQSLPLAPWAQQLSSTHPGTMGYSSLGTGTSTSSSSGGSGSAGISTAAAAAGAALAQPSVEECLREVAALASSIQRRVSMYMGAAIASGS